VQPATQYLVEILQAGLILRKGKDNRRIQEEKLLSLRLLGPPEASPEGLPLRFR
jgi:hypothetical protein